MINASLNEGLLDDFNQNGFLVLDKFLDLQHLDKLRERIEPLFKGDFETGIEPDEWNWKYGQDADDVTRQICNAWKSDNLIKQVVCSSIIGECVSKLMGWDGARLLQDNVLWKPSGGKSLLFHQDASYDDWVVPQTMVTCWIALDDTNMENGTLEFASGSHKWGLSPPSGNFHAPDDYKKELKKFEMFLILPEATSESDPSWFGFPITVKESAPFSKNDIVNHLSAKLVDTRPLFAGNLTKQPYFEDVQYRIVGTLSNTDLIMKNTFWIGVFPGLTKEMLEYVIQQFETFIVTHR